VFSLLLEEHWFNSLVVSCSISDVCSLALLSVVVHEDAAQDHKDNSDNSHLHHSLVELWLFFPDGAKCLLTGTEDEHSKEESCSADHSDSVIDGKLISVN